MFLNFTLHLAWTKSERERKCSFFDLKTLKNSIVSNGNACIEALPFVREGDGDGVVVWVCGCACACMGFFWSLNSFRL